MSDDRWVAPAVLLAVDLVILTLRESRLHVLLIERGIEPHQGALALPGGFLSHEQEDLLAAAHRALAEEAGLGPGQLHLEQLGIYGAPDRDPRGRVCREPDRHVDLAGGASECRRHPITVETR